ncbi:26S proteasome non-ATPase regulatory subunit 4 [Nymphon striatum]|nr:26S proteasome non-ATPase regulatory subunit 4 [Nymphon striatum]
MKKKIQNQPCKSIPGPLCSDPKNGNLVDIADSGSLHEYLVSLHETYGPISAFWWGERYVVSILSPEYFKKVNHLSNRPGELFSLFKPLISEKSIQYANDEDIKNRRSLYDPPYSHSSCQHYYEILQKIADEMAEKWKNLAENDCLDLTSECITAACLSITRTSFDEEQFKNYELCWDECERFLIEPFPAADTDRYKAFMKAKEEMLAIVQNIVDAKRANVRTSSEANFLETITEAEIYSDQILADSLTYMIGGFHTSGFLLTWMIYFLCLNPEIQDRVYDEMIEVLDDEPLTPACASQLIYTKQVIDESLRCSVLAPWAARYSDEDLEIDDYVVPKQTPIITALGVSLQNENYYPEPEKFDPDRFSPEKIKSRPSLAFQPFGFAGKRICPGYRFAYVEMYVFASVLFRKFKFHLAPGQAEVHKVYGLVTKPIVFHHWSDFNQSHHSTISVLFIYNNTRDGARNVDNSDFMRNGDFLPTRFQAQQDAVNLVSHAKTRANPENNVGLLTLAKLVSFYWCCTEVLVTLTPDAGRLLSKLHQVQPSGNINLITAMRIAHLVLKHRQGRNHKMRIVAFVGSPIEGDDKELVKLAKRLKKEKVNVDVISFGEDVVNSDKLTSFVNALNGKDGTGSHLVTIPLGPHLIDALVSSPVVQFGEGGSSVGLASGSGFEFGVDPNEDPELALALRVSMEEQRLRQEEETRKESAKPAEGTVEKPVTDDAKGSIFNSRGSEDALLEQALALSVGENTVSNSGVSNTTSGAPDFGSMTEEEQIAYAMQMSLQAQEEPMETEESATESSKKKGSGAESEDLSDVMRDPEFITSVLENLDGVDPNSEAVRSAINSLTQTHDDSKKNDKEEKK